MYHQCLYISNILWIPSCNQTWPGTYPINEVLRSWKSHQTTSWLCLCHMGFPEGVPCLSYFYTEISTHHIPWCTMLWTFIGISRIHWGIFQYECVFFYIVYIVIIVIWLGIQKNPLDPTGPLKRRPHVRYWSVPKVRRSRRIQTMRHHGWMLSTIPVVAEVRNGDVMQNSPAEKSGNKNPGRSDMSSGVIGLS